MWRHVGRAFSNNLPAAMKSEALSRRFCQASVDFLAPSRQLLTPRSSGDVISYTALDCRISLAITTDSYGGLISLSIKPASKGLERLQSRL